MRRSRQVRLHVIVALLVLLVLIAVNAFTNRSNPWWLWVLMVWMPLIAAHTAWAMGLFDKNNKGS
ncbi:MAG TPA: 2TM domain-containing protein [Reyranella sp.]|nr:2TM domain-containing protein [Reyranella sp.]